ncbi:MAG TPA: 50S ribosomal protein L22 [Ignavibacteria bacterium]|nr:50S ribosomal protein L22 [Ignavibacteria bacterium]
MEARAIKRFLRGSPRKMRLVVDLIRNKNVEEAQGILRFSKKHSAEIIEQTVVSAYSNLVNKLDSGKVGKSEVFIKEAFVDGGPVLKRMLPAPQGRAFRIRKRTSHLTIIVENEEEIIKTTPNVKEDKVEKVKAEKPRKNVDVEEVKAEEVSTEVKEVKKKATKPRKTKKTTEE